FPDRVRQPFPGGAGRMLPAERTGTEAENLQNIPVLVLTADASYHDVYDHCTVQWLMQAGVKTEHVELAKAGIAGNGHMMMLEKNSADIAKYIGGWLSKNARTSSGEAASKAMPGTAITTFSTENIARKR